MRKIDLIVIHCSATRENTDYSPEQLESDHKARGFLRAGYNFYIRKSGEVVNLRPLEQIRLMREDTTNTASEFATRVDWTSPDSHGIPAHRLKRPRCYV